MGADGAGKLSEGVSKLLNLTSLSLNFCNNKIGADGTGKLSECFSKLLNLTSLNLDL